MNDEEKRVEKIKEELWDKFRKITPEILSQFFFEKGVPRVSCPICNVSDMSVPQTSETIDFYNGIKDLRVTYVSPTHVPFFEHEPRFSLLHFEYRLICKNCGYVNRFAVFPVLKWFGDKEKEEKGTV
ncbi:hypothetical protein [Pantoea ananatis]|uniref:hypothetical protein n=1 Tax=Pantoea ananas TaxID=553 RepID=UPI000D5DC301|nr:hypothetical protein [Pantoea ananatis]PVY86606.1 hypothetical protein C7427_10258 [Pantoea ananatis]